MNEAETAGMILRRRHFQFLLVSSLYLVWPLAVQAAAPSKPPLVAPANYSVFKNISPHVHFQWQQVSNATNYHLYVSANAGLSDPKVHNETLPATYYYRDVYPNWPNNVYYWSVDAENAGQFSGVTGNIRTFILDTPLGAPTITSPAASPRPVYSVGARPVISWAAPGGGAVNRYQARLVSGTNLNSPSLIGNPTNGAEPVYSPYTLPAMLNAGTYTFAVRAMKQMPSVFGYSQSTYESVIGWGSYASITFDVVCTTPSPPALSSPASNATLSPGAIMFSWGASNGANRYRLKICTDSAMSQNITGSPFEPGIGVRQKDVTLSSGTYYWQVGAIGTNELCGWGAYGPSPAWRLNIVCTVPSPPSLTGPANNSTLSPGPVTFSWGTSSGANRYRLKICTDSAMSQNITGSPFEPGVGVRQKDVTLSSGTYYWQVGAIGTNELCGWGAY
ncbi:MAG: hypothetical protein HYV26_02195, partial [Candidatus Hydrogenedentes bacterium]|nr:hypothetical protein [Candidatus Hydrogenedentota bacterium]